MVLEAFEPADRQFDIFHTVELLLAAPPQTVSTFQFSSEKIRKLSERNQYASLFAQAAALREKTYPDRFRSRIDQLDRPGIPVEPGPELLAELNPEFEFQCVYPAETAGLPLPIVAQGQAQDGALYLLLKRSNALTLHRIAPDGENRRLNAVVEPDFAANFKPLYLGGTSHTLQITGGRAFLLSDAGALELPFDGTPPRRHTGFPGKIVGAEYKNGRLWFATEDMVLSAAPDGSDRRILLSKFDETDRILTDPAGRYQFQLRGFFAEPGGSNRFILIGTDNISRFDADAMTLTPLLQSHEFWKMLKSTVQYSGGRITIMNFLNENGPCSFGWWDLKLQRGGYLYCGPRLQLPDGTPPSPNSVPPVRYIPEPLPLQGSACLQGGILYTAGAEHMRSQILRVGTPERTPFWFFPRSNAVFPVADGRSVLLVTSHRVLKVTPKTETR